MSLIQLLLASVPGVGGSVAISNQSADDSSQAGIGGTGTASYKLGSNGVASASAGTPTLVAISGEWLVSGTASNFEAYATWSGSGGTVTGTTGSWLGLGSDRTWSLEETNGTATRTLAVQIRRASTGVVLDTATITFTVDSAP